MRPFPIGARGDTHVALRSGHLVVNVGLMEI